MKDIIFKMPYIRNDKKILIEFSKLPLTPGELNYAITIMIKLYLEQYGRINNYTDYNEVLGVLEAVKQEFYRRLIIPYEDKKIKENGDVY